MSSRVGSRRHPYSPGLSSLPQRAWGTRCRWAHPQAHAAARRGRNDETHPARGGAGRGGRAGVRRDRHLDRRGPCREVGHRRRDAGLFGNMPGVRQFEFDGRTYTVDLFYITNTPRSLLAGAERRGFTGHPADRPRSGVAGRWAAVRARRRHRFRRWRPRRRPPWGRSRSTSGRATSTAGRWTTRRPPPRVRRRWGSAARAARWF